MNTAALWIIDRSSGKESCITNVRLTEMGADTLKPLMTITGDFLMMCIRHLHNQVFLLYMCYAYSCMSLCACVRARMPATVRAGPRLTLRVFLSHSSFHGDCISHWKPELTWACLPQAIPVSASSAGITAESQLVVCHFPGFLGAALCASRMRGKHFHHWAISQPYHVF